MMNRHGLIKVRIIDLLPHELTRPKLKQKHIKSLPGTGRLTRPIIVHRIRERRKYPILDGYHMAATLNGPVQQPSASSTRNKLSDICTTPFFHKKV